MFLADLTLTRTTIFRWALVVGGIFALWIVLLFGAVYWRIEQYLIARSDAVITTQAETLAAAPREQRLDAIGWLLGQDPRNVQHAGLFSASGARLAGNVERIPADLQIDGPAQRSVVSVSNGNGKRAVRAVGRKLPGGDVLLIARMVDEGLEISEIVGETLVVGLLPALCLSLAAGILLSIRAQKRVEDVNERVQRIVAGDLRQRLPTRTKGRGDAFDNLASIVNGMLEKIEALINEIAGVGDDIAHDLRTPLTRVRVGLERGRANARTLEEAHLVLDRAIVGLDQSLSIVTALLRIAEIEHNRRLAGFGEVDLGELVREVGDLYEPIADEKHVTLTVRASDEPPVHGDRDLLLEAIANVVDNAIKFTPEGGSVELALLNRDGDSVVRVSDTGPGISDHEREIVTRRFYRSDRSRQTRGVGLGLSLVSAIITLHGFRLAITAGPGCVVEITCPRIT